MLRLIFILFFPTLCFAGGEYSTVRIIELSGHETRISFSVEFLNSHKFYENCDTITVHLNYKKTPWFSWLPFVHTSHPTAADNQEAVSYLKHVYLNDKTVNFGYMGSGLNSTDQQCVFISKGLRLYKSDNFQYVLSYHDPV